MVHRRPYYKGKKREITEDWKKRVESWRVREGYSYRDVAELVPCDPKTVHNALTPAPRGNKQQTSKIADRLCEISGEPLMKSLDTPLARVRARKLSDRR